MRPILALIAMLLFLPADVAAQSGEGPRIALVIGNAGYAEAPLRNAVNDARAIAASLRARGFAVIQRENATKLQMERAVGEFGERLREGATGLFFFAGHGMQVNGRNFLLPVDATISSEQRVRLETIDVDLVLEQMGAARTRVSVVILDACRNNPFERRFRSSGGGLAQINAPEGTLIAYATAPGKVAADGDGANGLYTSELLKAMATPGLKIEDVFKQVRINVSRSSNGMQVPWEASSLTGDFYFSPAAPVLQAAPAPTSDRDALFWDSIKNSSNPAEYRAYLEQFPAGAFAALARARLAALAPVSSSAPAPPPPMPPVTQKAPPAPQLAARLPTSMPAPLRGSFDVTLPPAREGGEGLRASVEIDVARIILAGRSGAGFVRECAGRGSVAPDGEIAPFEIRCTGGAAGGRSAERVHSVWGRVEQIGSVLTLSLQTRGPNGETRGIRATAR